MSSSRLSSLVTFLVVLACLFGIEHGSRVEADETCTKCDCKNVLGWWLKGAPFAGRRATEVNAPLKSLYFGVGAPPVNWIFATTPCDSSGGSFDGACDIIDFDKSEVTCTLKEDLGSNFREVKITGDVKATDMNKNRWLCAKANPME